MAEENTEQENEEENSEESKKGLSKKMIILISLGLVMLSIGAGGAMLFMGSSDEMTEEEMAADGVAVEEMADEDSMMDDKTSIYHELHPAFVANFSGKSKKNYMQVYIVAMAYEDSVIEDLKLHMPAVRNDVLMTLSNTTSDEIETVEGKEVLRQKVLEQIQDTMRTKTGKDGIEDIYFTKFVAQ